MRIVRFVGRWEVVLGLTALLALPARAPAQEKAQAQEKAEAPPGGEGESVRAIEDGYDRRLLELDRERLDRLTRLAARQPPADAVATYEHLFRRAIAGNLFREAEPAADAVLKGGSPSPTTTALAYLVKIVAQSDRGAHGAALATLTRAFEKAARDGVDRPVLLTSEAVALCDAFYQRLVQADQFDVARKAFRLALENVRSEPVKRFLAGRLTRLDLVGKPAPPLRGTDLDGKPFDLARTKGDVVVVVFWTTWAPPSADEAEWLKETLHAYGPRGLRVVGVNVDALRDGDEPPAAVLPDVRRFLLEHNVPWPNLVNGPGAADYAGAYGVTEVPANVVIARDGTVAHIDLVRHRLDAAIARELGR